MYRDFWVLYAGILIDRGRRGKIDQETFSRLSGKLLEWNKQRDLLDLKRLAGRW